MAHKRGVTIYSPSEERINIISHGAGLILSIIALAALVIRAVLYGNVWHIVSFSIFGTTLIVLYAASTLYHCAKTPETRSRLRINDHASIYALIAGSYTPFTLVTLNGPLGWTIFGISWGFALCGIILKIFFTGRFTLLSILMYVCMGWIIIFAIKPLLERFPPEGFYWVLAGGLAYTLGALLYAIKKIKFNHALFHIFVVLGSFLHFVAVFFYVLPVA